jgi:predicted lipoprotein with Yx(FWY)xxD motif
MKIMTLSALILGLAAQSAMALTVKSSEVSNKIREIALKEVRFEGAQKVVLTDAKGMSVYTFDLDTPGKSVCKGACLTAWPTVNVAADAQIVAPFGTITGNDGKRQLTLKGLPLYYYFQDKKPGDITGHYPEWQLVFVQN